MSVTVRILCVVVAGLVSIGASAQLDRAAPDATDTIDRYLVSRGLLFSARQSAIKPGTTVTDEKLRRAIVPAFDGDEPLTESQATFLLKRTGTEVRESDIIAWLVLRGAAADEEAASESLRAYQQAEYLGGDGERVENAYSDIKDAGKSEPTASEIAAITGLSESVVAREIKGYKERVKQEEDQAKKNVFSALQKRGFTLRRRLSGPEAGQAASFSFLESDNADAVFATTFALSVFQVHDDDRLGEKDSDGDDFGSRMCWSRRRQTRFHVGPRRSKRRSRATMLSPKTSSGSPAVVEASTATTALITSR